MSKSRLAALTGFVMLAAGGFLAFAQEFVAAPSAMGGQGRARVYSQGELIGFALIALALLLFGVAWRLAGRQHASKW